MLQGWGQKREGADWLSPPDGQPLPPRQVLKKYVHPGKTKSDFVAACPTPQGDYILAAGEDRALYCFKTVTAEVERNIAVSAGGSQWSAPRSRPSSLSLLHSPLTVFPAALQTPHERDIINVAHHPKLNIAASYSDEGRLLLWRPE